MKFKSVLLAILFLFLGTTIQSQVFEDSPAVEADGNFPQNWDLLRGSASISTFNGEKVIELSHRAIITPKFASQNYLSENFTLEFDAYFSELELPIYYYQYYDIRLWSGTANATFNESSFYDPIHIYRNGLRIIGRVDNYGKILDEVYDERFEDLVGAWRHILLEYNNGAFKVSIDGVVLLNQPMFKFTPQMISLGSNLNSTTGAFKRGLKNIRLTGITSGVATTVGANPGSSSPADQQTDYPYTLPPIDGNTDQILQTDGKGTVSWVNLPVAEPSSNGTSSTTTPPQTSDGYSGLEALNEGNGVGWRLKDMDPNNYGNIGKNAVDLSVSRTPVETGAVGENSFAQGFEAKATHQYDIALGFRSEARGSGSIAMGDSARALGSYSIALGGSSVAGDQSVAIGTSAGAGVWALALGEDSKAAAFYAIAFGKSAAATEENSISIGQNVKASGRYSVAMGYSAEASGVASVALGSRANASGSSSVALGTATKSSSPYSTAIGRYNIGEGGPEDWKLTDPLFEIGNSNDGIARGNALTVLKNGNVGIGTHKPRIKLHIEDGEDASRSSGGYLLLGDKQKENLVFDNNEIMARNNVQPSTLYLQNDGGNVFVGGNLAHSSDKRLKQDISNLSYGLQEVLQLRPVSYHWKTNPNAAQKSIGLIAQEVQPIITELVTTNTIRDNMLGVNYTELIPVLIKAIQEQQEIISQQGKKIHDLSADLNEKNDFLTSLELRMKQLESLVNTN